jgi:hypothetical protein
VQSLVTRVGNQGYHLRSLYDHRCPDDRFVWLGRHVCITQPTCSQDLDCEFIWLGLQFCMIHDDIILWPGLQDSMTCEAATMIFYDLDDRFLWTGSWEHSILSFPRLSSLFLELSSILAVVSATGAATPHSEICSSTYPPGYTSCPWRLQLYLYH